MPAYLVDLPLCIFASLRPGVKAGKMQM